MHHGPREDGSVEIGEHRTRFSDVCGTIDELKRVLHEQPDLIVAAPDSLEALIDDTICMQERMEIRLHEYERFSEEIVTIAAVLQELGGSRRAAAAAAAAALKTYVRRDAVLNEQERAEAVAWAEAVREVAQHLEKKLYRYKDLALALARAYQAIQGNRSWVLDESEADAAPVVSDEPLWMRWLPISPHRERILRYLRSGRARLLPPRDGVRSDGAEPPMVEFEDGGVMPLSSVRWSEEVRNFHPVDVPPHPHGLLYRDSHA